MYFITFSEMLGTNGDKIARQVSKTLQYIFYGEEELLKAGHEMGILSDIAGFDERSLTLLEKVFSEKPKVYLDQFQSVIYELAKRGNAVFLGRGSQLLLNAFDCAFHVLVTGSIKKRVQRVMEEKQIGGEAAEKLIRQSDQDKRGFLRYAFDEEWLNPSLYDLILNTDKLSVDSAVKILIAAATSDDIKTCGLDSVKSLGKLSLQRKVEAALLEAGLLSQYLYITVEDLDSVRLYGMVGSPEKKEKIGDVLKNIKEIKKITNEITIFKSSGGTLP
jgi:cytidylate kinase